jgi:hypothetical protein
VVISVWLQNWSGSAANDLGVPVSHRPKGGIALESFGAAQKLLSNCAARETTLLA